MLSEYEMEENINWGGELLHVTITIYILRLDLYLLPRPNNLIPQDLCE